MWWARGGMGACAMIVIVITIIITIIILIIIMLLPFVDNEHTSIVFYAPCNNLN